LSRLFQHLMVAGIIVLAAAAPAHAADFLKAIEDVPLPKGMTEQGEPVVFESEQGRVVKTTAEGQLGGAAISSFYEQSLPALGWKRTAGASALTFEREGERLGITIREPASARPVRVTFELVVKVASTKLAE
jgi:hypothetical protein